jgi:biotin carboxylase
VIRPRIMVVASTAAYQTHDFVAAAERMGVDVGLGTDRCHVLAQTWAEGALPLDFRDPSAAAATLVAAARTQRIDGFAATDERTAYIAALAAAELGLRGNPPESVRAAWNKLAFRRRMRAAGLPQPRFLEVAPIDRAGVLTAARELGYPVVIKPVHLSASRGVMRADHEVELAARADRLRQLMADPEVRAGFPDGADAADRCVVEQFVAGAELALEGLLVEGRLHTLALFDKPDPLDGPFFAETLYVTPAPIAAALAEEVNAAVGAAAAALGLVEGPIHAEVRLGAVGPVVLELAARSIGGLCARALQFGAGVSLEELVIGHAIGRAPSALSRSGAAASGVAMLPVPEPGVLRAVSGAHEARRCEGISDVVITARVGDTVVPLPEGHTYMGFVFATGVSAAEVTAHLRQAVAAIRFLIAPRL